MHTIMEAMVYIEAPWSQPATSSATGWAIFEGHPQLPRPTMGSRSDEHALFTLATRDTLA